jgi:predicted GH43/DUF377 family glycosyl hydrolase
VKKDIEIPIVENVFVAIIHEWDDDMLHKVWNAYLINNKETAIDMVIVVSKGYNDTKSTSTIRHGLSGLEAYSYKKIEPLQEEIFALDNEFYLTFFEDNKLFDKKFIFPKNTINENVLSLIPLMEQKGIISK